MLKKKYYDNRIVVVILQLLTIGLLSFSKVDFVFKLMLLFGYVMLFRQERWHKHLLIMFVMIGILFSATHIYNVK